MTRSRFTEEQIIAHEEAPVRADCNYGRGASSVPLSRKSCALQACVVRDGGQKNNDIPEVQQDITAFLRRK